MRLRVGRGQVDRDVGDLRGPAGFTLVEPVDHRRGAAAVDLGEQPLVAGDVDQAGVPAVHPPPPTGVGVGLPFGLTAAGLVDARHRNRGRLVLRGHIGDDDDLIVHGMSPAPVVGGHRDHRVVLVEDLSGHHRLGPGRDTRPRRDAGHGLGEHLPLAYSAGTQPFSFAPSQFRPVRSDLDITRAGGHPAFRSDGAFPTFGADPDPLRGGHHIDRPAAVCEALYQADDHTIEIEQK